MKRTSISLFACLIVVLLTAQYAAAQAFQGSTEEVFRQEGIASWYGAQFEGRPTASGEIFNPGLFTAAHPTLPFGTFLIVTNRNNNRQVSVRVNDRGPFVDGRIIDLSQAAAEHLGMIVTGTAPVIIETIPGSLPQAPAQQPPAQVQQAQPRVVQQQPQQVVVQPQVQQQPLAQQPAPVSVTTTTVPLEAPPNVPITINIFHSLSDPSLPPTVEVVPAAPQATPRAVQAPVSPQAQQPQIIVVPAQPAPEQWREVPQAVVAVPPAPQPQPVIVATAPPAPQPASVEEWHPPQAMTTVPISADPNGTYRVQVGSFRVARNAVDTFVRLRDADFEPSYERNGEFFRVVLAGIRGTEIQSTVDRLEALGYHGVVVMME